MKDDEIVKLFKVFWKELLTGNRLFEAFKTAMKSSAPARSLNKGRKIE